MYKNIFIPIKLINYNIITSVYILFICITQMLIKLHSTPYRFRVHFELNWFT